MFEVKIVTACRAQVRQKEGMADKPYKGPIYLSQTLHHIWHSDLDWDKVSVFHDSLKQPIENMSPEHAAAIKAAKDSGAKVILNPGGGFVQNSLQALKYNLDQGEEYLILLEDDVQVCKTIKDRLTKWVEKNKTIKFATLYGVSGFKRRTIPADQFWGAQALLIHKDILPDLIYWTEHYDELGKGFPQGGVDLKYSRIVGKKLGFQIYNHVPAVVEHLGMESSWPGGYQHKAADFVAE